jgi:hypothetical protein
MHATITHKQGVKMSTILRSLGVEVVEHVGRYESVGEFDKYQSQWHGNNCTGV